MTTRITRHGRGLILVATCAFVGLLHTVLRGDPWVFEWRWASFQYQFATVLLSPFAAGIGAWEGTVWRRAGDGAAAAGRVGALAVRSIASLVGWIGLGFVVGVAPVVSAVIGARGADWPGWGAIAMFVPALALVMSLTTVGWVLGWRFAHPLTVPFVAGGAFLLLIAGYSAAPDPLLRIGGATSSLLELHVPVRTQIWQTVLFSAVAGAALLVLLRRSMLASDRVERRLALVVATAMVGLPATVLLAGDGDLFVERSVGVSCVGSTPRVCLAAEYGPARGRLAERMAPSLEELAALGAPSPTEVRQSSGGLVTDVIVRSPELAPSVVVDGLLPAGCRVPYRSALYQDVTELSFYLQVRAAGETARAAGEARDGLRRAAERVATCEGA